MKHYPMLLTIVIVSSLQGCAAEPSTDSYLKLGEIMTLVEGMRDASARDPGFRHAHHTISINPDGWDTSSYYSRSTPSWTCNLRWSEKTIDESNVAVVVEALVLPNGELRAGTDLFFWSGGRWLTEIEMAERIHGKEEVDRWRAELAEDVAGWLTRRPSSPATSPATGL